MDCANERLITLAEWETIKGDEIKGEKEEDIVYDQGDELEEVKEADEGDMLVLRRFWSN